MLNIEISKARIKAKHIKKVQPKKGLLKDPGTCKPG
jgi:hypothetical protein